MPAVFHCLMELISYVRQRHRHNYKPVDDFIVWITENKPNTPQVWRVLLDKEFEAKLKIIKQDDETKKTC